MTLWQDVRFAVRLLIKDKWFTLVAAVALALGIGVNNTVFTFVNAVLLRGLPFPNSDRIVAIVSHDRVRDRDFGVSYLDFKDWSEASRSFTGLAAYDGGTMNVSDEGRTPERVAGSFVTANAFGLLGQAPLVGRDFVPQDDRPGAGAVAILGYGIWKNRYASDPTILGRSIRINDVPSVVVGVMPEGFKFPENTDLWQPLAMEPGFSTAKRNARGLDVFGRLADRVTLAQARSELSAIGTRLSHDFPDTNQDIQPKVQTFSDRVNGGPIRLVFLSLMGAVAFVLLIACANVANLLLARSAHRVREISVRVSLGATRWRIARQLLVESVMLALISGILGFVVSVFGIRWFDSVTQDVGKPYWIQFTMDRSVFAFLASICLGTGIVFGLAPALHVSKTDVNEVLKEGGRSGTGGVRARRWTGALIVAELALTLTLLAGAGFMIRSFLSLYRLDLGIETSHLLLLRLELPDRKYSSPEQRLAFYQQFEDRLRANPRIQAASLASNLPMQGGFTRRLEIEGRSLPLGEQPPRVTMLTIDPTYFETVGLSIARGRRFTDADGLPGHGTAIVNQRFAQLHFKQEDAIGQRIVLSMDLMGGAPPPGAPISVTATVIGVVSNLRQRNVTEPDPDAVAYLPIRTDPRAFMTLVARTTGDPSALTPLLREEVRAIDPNLPLFNIRTMEQDLARQRWPFRVFGTLFTAFAAIALLLSSVGLYAVTAYSVTQRTPEIGVRMALGAQPKQVWWLIMRRSFSQLVIGLSIGMAGAFGVGRLLKSLLVQIGPSDPATLVSIGAVFVVVSVMACLWPARRATELDPLVALRYE